MLHQDRLSDHLHESGTENGRAVPVGEFDWDSVDRNAFGIEPAEDQISFSDASAAIAIVLDFICQAPGKSGKNTYLQAVAGKALSLHFLISPTNSQFTSMTAIAAEIGMTKAVVSKWMLDLRDQLHVVIGYSGKLGGSRETFSRAQKAAVACGVHSSASRKDRKAK